MRPLATPVTRRLLTHTPRHRLRSPDGLRTCHAGCEEKANRRARCYGLAPALSRLRGTYALARFGGGVRSRWSLTCPATRLAAMGASNVVGCAGDAAPSRAGPRLNVGPNYVRPATGQRRITARVMRSFGRRLPHTLPFPAHPRVASRPKSPAPAVATLFGLPATLRAGTESVLFPWRCSW